jgi:uncharacterized protein YgbK (DUF1537 family)
MSSTSPGGDQTVGRAAPAELGVLCEDLQGALSAASRLQQRGINVQVVQSQQDELLGVEAVVVDMNLHNVVRDPQQHVARWTRWLRSAGCRRLEARFDSALRGTPADCIAGLVEGSDDEDPLVLAVPGYPSAGRVCVDGRMMIPSLTEASLEVQVGPSLFPQGSVTQISLTDVTAGAPALLKVLERAWEAGERHLVFDATTDGHLATIASVAEQLRQQGLPLVTASSGGWLRHYPDLGSDGFVIVAGPSQHEVDQAQLSQIANAFGSRSLVTTASEVLAGSKSHLQEVIALHRVLIIHEAERREDDPWIIAADFGTAVRRLLDISLTGRHPCLGVITSGGLTTSAVIRGLGAQSLRPGQELEPLCPVVRLVDGSFDNLPVISKASGIGTAETPVRLIRRLIGT